MKEKQNSCDLGPTSEAEKNFLMSVRNNGKVKMEAV